MNKPTIFGRERAMIDALTTKIFKHSKTLYPFKTPIETDRGNTFELEMEDGRIASVTIELARVEVPA